MTVVATILFVGNSFVTRNEVPALVSALAATAGVAVRTATIAAGGASLRRHYNSGAISAALARDRWDQVVLQEQSTLPIKNRARFHDNVRAVRDEIAAASAASGHPSPPAIVLYNTWARRSARPTQVDLDTAVAAIATEIDARVAPVGRAWEVVLASHPEVELYDRDGSHPTAAGSFLAACALALTMFADRRSQILAPSVPKVDPGTAAVLLDAARSVA